MQSDRQKEIITNHVRKYFNQTHLYLGFNYGRMVRFDAIKHFIQDHSYTKILDIGCGNGDLSIPLIQNGTHLTLLDISENMLELARNNIQHQLKSQVDLIHGDIFNVKLKSKSFNLILCIGVLAHINDIGALLNKITDLLSHEGVLILQFTNTDHLYRKILNIYNFAVNKIRKPQYLPNPTSISHIQSEAAKHGLNFIQDFRYNLPPPLLKHLFTDAGRYKFIKRIYGSPSANYGKKIGSETIIKYIKA